MNFGHLDHCVAAALCYTTPGFSDSPTALVTVLCMVCNSCFCPLRRYEHAQYKFSRLICLRMINFPTNVWFISYSKCSNWHQILKFLSNFGCLFTFCYSAWANSIKTKLQTCNLQTGQSITYKYVNQF